MWDRIAATTWLTEPLVLCSLGMASEPPDGEPLPEGWRKTWQRPSGRPRARARQVASELVGLAAIETVKLVELNGWEIPSSEELQKRAMRALLAVADNEAANQAARVSAAKAIQEWDERRAAAHANDIECRILGTATVRELPPPPVAKGEGLPGVEGPKPDPSPDPPCGASR